MSKYKVNDIVFVDQYQGSWDPDNRETIYCFGVIEKDPKGKCRVLDYGAINTPKEEDFPVRLAMIQDGMKCLINKFKPDAIAVEELFFNQNITTGIAVAEARGVILLACKQSVKNLYEYTPLQIKQALTGNGRAEKQQVQYMVKAILNLKNIPKPDDAADAIAVALCHSETNVILSGTDIK